MDSSVHTVSILLTDSAQLNMFKCLQGLTIQDLEDLLEDIKVYMDMEQGKNADYWRDITTVTEDELAQLRKIDPNTKGT